MVTATQSTHKKERGPHLGKGADQGLSRFLDAEKRSATACQFEHAMREKIVGQDEAVQALVDIYQVFCAGLHSPGRPVGNLLFLGPTGSGKTRTVEAAAEILFGDSRAVIKVDCAEFQHSHEIEKASDSLWQLLLGMLDKATLTLGDNRKVDLSQTVIFLTSNLGGSQIADLMQGGMGFIQPGHKAPAGLHEKVERTAVEAARRKFSP